MNPLEIYLQSGILESYIRGEIDPEKAHAVEQMADEHDSVRNKLDELSREIETAATAGAIHPPAYIKSMVMASVDYMQRMNEGELPSDPPALHENSKISDYDQWIHRKDFTRPEIVEGMHIRIIRQSQQITTAVVWMQEMTTEVHEREIEKFLIVEGSCEVAIGHNIHKLKAGDIMSIPTGIKHRAVSTSTLPCKIILQRIADFA